MIEKFTQEEIDVLIEELREYGMSIKEFRKGRILTEEATKVLGGVPYFYDCIRKSILEIADFLTNNYEEKEKKTVKRTTVPKDKEEEYRSIISGILSTMKKYYGIPGFRNKKYGG